jgi:hypothetical protein
MSFGSALFKGTGTFEQDFFQIALLSMIIRVAIVYQHPIGCEKDFDCLLKGSILASFPSIVMYQVQIRVLDSTALRVHTLTEHICGFVRLLRLVD